MAPWQSYIHGAGATSEYLELSSDFKNPADTSDAQGIRISIVSECPLMTGSHHSYVLGWNLLLEWSDHGAERNNPSNV